MLLLHHYAIAHRKHYSPKSRNIKSVRLPHLSAALHLPYHSDLRPFVKLHLLSFCETCIKIKHFELTKYLCPMCRHKILVDL